MAVSYTHLPMVYLLHFFGNDIHGYHLMMLCQKRGNTHSYIASSGYGNFIPVSYTHLDVYKRQSLCHEYLI